MAIFVEFKILPRYNHFVLSTEKKNSSRIQDQSKQLINSYGHRPRVIKFLSNWSNRLYQRQRDEDNNMNVRHWTALHFGEPPLSTQCDWHTCTSVLGQYSGNDAKQWRSIIYNVTQCEHSFVFQNKLAYHRLSR